MVSEMNAFKIDWSSRSKLRGPGETSIGELILKLRDKLAPESQGISISYVDDRTMRKLNREHRGLNQTTDILSFPAQPEKGAWQHLGDLVISLPMADKMAKKLGVSRRREVETLIIHGFLHLCGLDHEQDKGEMLATQQQLEHELLGVEPLPMSLKRGRKAGSKVKKLKDGTRVVVTGRAATAIARKQKLKKIKPVKKVVKAKKAEAKPKRGPGRPRKVVAESVPKTPLKRAPSRRRTVRPRSGVIA
jgi:probable rRNA maturation factor